VLKTQKNIFLLNNQLLEYRFSMAGRPVIASGPGKRPRDGFQEKMARSA
jgi:hypothetical protein